jgi:MFS family permease
MLVYAFNYVDRQIVTILAVHIKTDLAISDAHFGLLFGTTFALFYGLFSIPLARLADGWSRVKTLGLALSFWSGMTVLSGLSSNFGELAAARVGVSIGEAGATPAGVSILGDYFQRRMRATAIAIYSIGIYLGSGAALMIGGPVVINWAARFARPEDAPLGLAGWQAAFMVAGAPGLLLALVILLTVREPERGGLEGRPHPNDPTAFRTALGELATMFPPWSLHGLTQIGAPRRAIGINLVWLGIAIVFGALATIGSNALMGKAAHNVIGHLGSIVVTTNHVQWTAMAVALYALSSWFQFARIKDPAADRFITGSRTFMGVTVAGAALAFTMNAVNAFVFVYAKHYHDMGAEAGLKFGAIAIVAGASGIAVSGFLSDRARRIATAGRLYFACATTLLFSAASFVEFTTSSVSVFTGCYGIATFFLPMWFAPLQATTQDLVTPRLRGVAFAIFSIGPNVIGLGLGPYLVGLMSDATGDLRFALLVAVGTFPLAIAALLFAARNLAKDEAKAWPEMAI